MADITLRYRDKRVLEDYLKDISKIPLISVEEERVLARSIRNGDPEALRNLVEANLRYVVSVAKTYAGFGIPLEDLINEGNMGLIRAAKRFDETKGCKFISYAVWWIRQAILTAITAQARIVKLPMNRQAMLQKITKIRNTFFQETGRLPSVHEIAIELGIDQENVLCTMAGESASVSLEAPLFSDADFSLMDILQDQSRPHPDEDMYEGFLPHDIEKALATLTAREAEVIRMYFGLGGKGPFTLSEIGEQFRVTRERARQIKIKALHKLQHHTRSQHLSVYVT